VTGGSRGLGRAIVHRLCRSGAHVLVNYQRNETAAQQVVEEVADTAGTATAIRADVSSPDEVRSLLDTVAQQHGRLDIFIHNAATFRPMEAANVDLDVFYAEQALALNPLLVGAPQLAKLMEGGGRIIAISGNGASEVVPGYVAPGVAKAALEALVRYLAVEFAPRGISVNAVATAMLDKDDDPRRGHMRDLMTMLAARTPAGHLSRPDDVANAVVWLCGPATDWIHGQVVLADGGLGLRA